MNVAQLVASGVLTFVDALSHVQASIDPSCPSLRPLLDLISPILESSKDPYLVILDDITSLNWIGFSLLDVERFARALVAKCRQVRRGKPIYPAVLSFLHPTQSLTLAFLYPQHEATLIIRHHLTTPGDPDEVFRHLHKLCTYHLEVRALATGRSGAVSGEVGSPHLPRRPPAWLITFPRSRSIWEWEPHLGW